VIRVDIGGRPQLLGVCFLTLVMSREGENRMKASVYVGRVGGLAVALGVGAASAVLGAPGVAWASPEQSASSSERGGSASEKTSGRSEGSGRTVRSGAGRVSADPTARDTAGPAMPAVESDTAPRSRGVRAPLKDPTTLTVPAAAREKSQAAADSPRPSASVAVIAEPPIAGQVVAEQVEGPLVDKVAPAAEPVVVVDAAALAESATAGGSAVGAVAAPVTAAAAEGVGEAVCPEVTVTATFVVCWR